MLFTPTRLTFHSFILFIVKYAQKSIGNLLLVVHSTKKIFVDARCGVWNLNGSCAFAVEVLWTYASYDGVCVANAAHIKQSLDEQSLSNTHALILLKHLRWTKEIAASGLIAGIANDIRWK